MRSMCFPLPPPSSPFGGRGRLPQRIDATLCASPRGRGHHHLSRHKLGGSSPAGGRCSSAQAEAPPHTCRAGVTSVGASVRLCGMFITCRLHTVTNSTAWYTPHCRRTLHFSMHIKVISMVVTISLNLFSVISIPNTDSHSFMQILW